MQRLIYTLSAVLLVVAIAKTIFADDEPAVVEPERSAILTLLTQLETGFSEGDAKGLASHWKENGEFVGPTGARADGRENIEKHFQAAFAARKQAVKLQIHLNHLQLVSDGLALVEATAEVRPAVASGGVPVTAFVLVKQGGHWLIANARETVAHLPPPRNPLKEIEWLVGNWSSETSNAGITLSVVCNWAANRAFLIRKFKVEGKGTFLHGGTEMIGWDPRPTASAPGSSIPTAVLVRTSGSMTASAG